MLISGVVLERLQAAHNDLKAPGLLLFPGITFSMPCFKINNLYVELNFVQLNMLLRTNVDINTGF